MLERGSKVFSCFLDDLKAFDTVWVDGLLFKLFSELGINGRRWLVIKDLYTYVKAKVLYAGALSREIDILQGTGQGRILAPFMNKVYINSLLKVLTDHCYAISINRLSLPSPSFAHDISLLALYPSFLETFMNICHAYGKARRYEFNHTKSGVVTFGETKPIHSQLMREREWMLGESVVDELFEYKNLGVYLKKLMFWGRLITEPKMAPAVRSLFSSGLDSFFDANITSRGVLATICDSLHKYNLFHYLELWFR